VNVDVLISKEGWLGSFQVCIVQNENAITHLWKERENYLMTFGSIVYTNIYTNRQGYSVTYCSIFL
jgi:hypothetical protein